MECQGNTQIPCSLIHYHIPRKKAGETQQPCQADSAGSKINGIKVGSVEAYCIGAIAPECMP